MTTRPSARLASRLAGMRADRAFAAVDSVLIVTSYLFVIALQRTSALGLVMRHAGLPVVIALVAHLLANAGWGLYGRVWRHASVDEARRLVGAGASVALLFMVLNETGVIHVHQVVILLGPSIATFFMATIRFRSRLFAWQRDGGEPGRSRVAIIGAGNAAAAVIREMRWDTACGMRPVVAFDDDRRKHGRYVMGVPVAGGMERLPDLAADYGVDEALLAISSPAPEVVQRAADAAEAAGVTMKVLPDLRHRIAGPSPMRRFRDARIEDLLGRTQVQTDFAAVAALVAGRRVLVTGAGGSIGSEIVRQLVSFRPSRLVLLDHDETLLHDVMATIDGKAEDVLADIRDPAGVKGVFAETQPEIVFHAAALKHVPILQRHPVEAALTNVFGTLNVVQAAVDVGVERFVFISTDKAVRPTSVLGISKWLGEQIVFQHAGAFRSYCCVRFGNVLGSRGSVVPTFRRQIEAGGPVTVTDPEMTRFFMSVEEAVALVLQAAVFAHGADMFMLEMGEPVNIYQLAQRMIRLTVGPDAVDRIPITFTGARSGEKWQEELSLPEDVLLATDHRSITRLVPTMLPQDQLMAGLERLRFLVQRRREQDAAAWMFSLATWLDHDRRDDDAVVMDDARGELA